MGRYGRVRTPEATRAYEHKVAVYALRAGLRPRSGPVAVRLKLFFRDRRRRDLDNCAKALLDALNSIAYEDDSQVQELTAAGAWDPQRPRAEVTISSLESPQFPTSPSPGGGHVPEAGPSPITPRRDG